MKKNKVQVVIFHTAQSGERSFLLLQMNEKRKFFWQNITGGVDKNETFRAAALRESVEETGLLIENIITLSPLNLQFEFTDQWQNEVCEQVFYCEVKNKWEITLDPNEHCSYQWQEEKKINESSVHYSSNLTSIKQVINRDRK